MQVYTSQWGPKQQQQPLLKMYFCVCFMQECMQVWNNIVS